MNHILFNDAEHFDVAILIKEPALKETELKSKYVEHISSNTRDMNILGFSLNYGGAKKPSTKTIKSYLNVLLPNLDRVGIHHILCADAEYFKKLCKVSKAEPYYGYVLPCAIEGFEHIKVVLTTNYQALFFNPSLQDKIDVSLNALVASLNGTYTSPDQSLRFIGNYPEISHLDAWFERLHQYDELTCDIETFHLKHYKAGLGTIGFAWDKSNGVAFCVDIYQGEDNANLVRQKLRKFFEEYQGTLTFHNASFDMTVLIYQLWMDHLLDSKGLIQGLNTLTKKFHCTRVITYLATNSTAGNKLGLKDQAHEFAGNYAQEEIENILRIPEDKLLEYNVIDCLCTWYVKEKHWNTLVQDNQLNIYETLMLPSLRTIIQMQLTGLCLDMDRVLHAEKRLTRRHDAYMKVMLNSPVMQDFITAEKYRLQTKDFEDRKAKAKKPENLKIKPIEAFDHVTFNPNSNPQLQRILYEQMDLPVIDKTKKKQPATGADTIKKLINHADPTYVPFLKALRAFIKVEKILSAFIPSFKEAPLANDGYHYLFGFFNLGGTVSGRLSSSKVNLQQLPSTGSPYAKVIKSCFIAPKDWIFCGADFASLEDRISALTTKDANKIRVYTQGYDGHCLRAYYYFKESMPDIDPESVDSINSIASKYSSLRQESKAPTFLLTYGGSYMGMMSNLGWDYDKSKAVEQSYHEMYVESDKWVQDKLKKACKDGFVEVAFGLRVRTPILAQTMLNTSHTPHEAEAEGRTAGNALGQSYGLLNSRAANEFMERVWASPYVHDIRICAQIHDAIYLLIRNDVEVVEWVNNNLTDCMAWQELPEIQHDEVKLFGELDLFYPNWSKAITLKPNMSQDEIKVKCG